MISWGFDLGAFGILSLLGLAQIGIEQAVAGALGLVGLFITIARMWVSMRDRIIRLEERLGRIEDKLEEK